MLGSPAMAGSWVTILFGGTSNERRVSVASAQNVASVLDEAAAWFLAPNGAVFEVERADLGKCERPFERDFVPLGPARFATLVEALESAPGRVYFLALHGGEGEDGTIQRMLEARRIAFTGPGAEASARAFDKEVAKQVANAAGLRIARSVHLSSRPDLMRQELRDMLALSGRTVVKPVAGGSTLGVHFIFRPEDLEPAARAVETSGEGYLAEEFVEGIELTVGVVDGPRGARALPATEVRLDPGRAFDYEGKYLGKGTKEITPAEVPQDVARTAQDVALRAHIALGCEGYSRTDIIVGRGGPVFLELNTLPGLTRMSFVPQQLAAEGTTMLQFLEGQIGIARARRDRQPQSGIV
ncbi:MAG: ATP-grasp domain-containing protein [Deltaproteobacteria bacterium]|nr:MAG: ATP-grasp domain-containing protein [Deltaproteobacteria bacterium]